MVCRESDVCAEPVELIQVPGEKLNEPLLNTDGGQDIWCNVPLLPFVYHDNTLKVAEAFTLKLVMLSVNSAPPFTLT